MFHTQHPAIINFSQCFNTSYKISFATVLVALICDIEWGLQGSATRSIVTGWTLLQSSVTLFST
jgi:hypothetical protein